MRYNTYSAKQWTILSRISRKVYTSAMVLLTVTIFSLERTAKRLTFAKLSFDWVLGINIDT